MEEDTLPAKQQNISVPTVFVWSGPVHFKVHMGFVTKLQTGFLMCKIQHSEREVNIIFTLNN